MSGKKVYLESGAQFTIVGGAAVTLFKNEDVSRVNIDWGSTIDLAGSKPDPDSGAGAFVGEFTQWVDDVPTIHRVYVEDGKEPGDVLFYYYAPVQAHKTYLKEGTTFEVEWRESPVKVDRPAKLDIDESLTFGEHNLSLTEIDNDGLSKGVLAKDGTLYKVFLEHFNNGEIGYYCYFG
jgi:hypothetical protein